MLPELLPATIFSFFLVFGRLGAAFMVLPGIGEAFIAPRIRLAIALAMSFAILPFVQDTLPALPDGLHVVPLIDQRSIHGDEVYYSDMEWLYMGTGILVGV